MSHVWQLAWSVGPIVHVDRNGSPLTVCFGEDLFGCLGPSEGLAAVVPACDEGADLADQLADGGEGAAVDGLAFDDAEPDLDHAQRRPGGRGQVHVDPRVGRQPGLDPGVFVGGVVVHHQVQLAVGVGAGDVPQEGQELCAGAAAGTVR